MKMDVGTITVKFDWYFNIQCAQIRTNITPYSPLPELIYQLMLNPPSEKEGKSFHLKIPHEGQTQREKMREESRQLYSEYSVGRTQYDRAMDELVRKGQEIPMTLGGKIIDGQFNADMFSRPDQSTRMVYAVVQNTRKKYPLINVT